MTCCPCFPPPPFQATWDTLHRHLASPRVAAFRPGQPGTAAACAALAAMRRRQDPSLRPSARFRRASALVRRAMVPGGAGTDVGTALGRVAPPSMAPLRPVADWSPWREVPLLTPWLGPHASAAAAGEAHAALRATLGEVGSRVIALASPHPVSVKAERTAAALRRVVRGTFFAHPRGTARHAAWLLRRGDAAPVTCAVEGGAVAVSACEGHRRWLLPLPRLLWARSVLWLQQPVAVEVAVWEGGGGHERPLLPREEALLLLPSPAHAAALLRAIAAALGEAPTTPTRVARAATTLARAGRLSWLRWLLAVNVAAGRTFQELSQYPVAPWVLGADGDTRQPRDLTRPAAVQEPARAARAVERMQAMGGAFVPPPDPFAGVGGGGGAQSSGGPAFAHGSLYSSLGVVVFFNVRLPAFAGAARQLQGGKFDHPDRMFWSLPATWQNCQQRHVLARAHAPTLTLRRLRTHGWLAYRITLPCSDADAKELVPELFCTPAVLRNASGLAFGRRQDGSAIDDVALPPWAETPEEFVRTNAAVRYCSRCEPQPLRPRPDVPTLVTLNRASSPLPGSRRWRMPARPSWPGQRLYSGPPREARGRWRR